ncbi:unnamed protein product [Larinioides sclopetarius]|uniref:THAP-type domain-containing protein n=1 Tax=Larinioides sclopetarius TaxID=280406 RepID=A0AAV2AD29_9ARAC
MPTHCSAFGCTNSSGKKSCRREGISFHKYPLTDKALLGRWLLNVRRANFEPTPYSFLCSKHFTEDDFTYQPFTNRRGLKKGAVPTRFSFNSYKPGHKRKNGRLNKDENHEVYGNDNSSEPVSNHHDTESNEIQMDNAAVVEILMNEKFYPPEHLKALANGLPTSSKSIQKSSHTLDERIIALKESLHAKILLRSLKKQLLDAEIKAANAKRDYFEAKTATVSHLQDAVDSEDSSDSETESPLQSIKSSLEEEELAAQIEERMLKEQLQEAQKQAASYEKDYYEAKSSMLFCSWQDELC